MPGSFRMFHKDQRPYHARCSSLLWQAVAPLWSFRSPEDQQKDTHGRPGRALMHSSGFGRHALDQRVQKASSDDIFGRGQESGAWGNNLQHTTYTTYTTRTNNLYNQQQTTSRRGCAV